MTRERKFLYNVFYETLERGEIRLGNVVAINPNDAILEFLTVTSDPLAYCPDKALASRHLGYYRTLYKVRLAKKDGR